MLLRLLPRSCCSSVQDLQRQCAQNPLTINDVFITCSTEPRPGTDKSDLLFNNLYKFTLKSSSTFEESQSLFSSLVVVWQWTVSTVTKQPGWFSSKVLLLSMESRHHCGSTTMSWKIILSLKVPRGQLQSLPLTNMSLSPHQLTVMSAKLASW